MKTRPAGIIKKNYEVEHVLEWHLVTDVFEWIRNKSQQYPNPDPNAQDQVGFCEYFKAHWEGAPAFAIGLNTRDPIDHIHAYAGTGSCTAELVWLQKPINAPVKSNMWASKSTTGIDVYDASKSSSEINGGDITKARIALMKLIYLISARIHMRDRAIKNIFKKQKVSIGDILNEIDINLVNHPMPEQTAWQQQNLRTLWNT
jgi:hypothetical protein